MSKYITVINGRFLDEKDANVSILDHGFLFGDSIYEVVRTVKGRLFGADRHLQRLHASAEGLGLRLPLMDNQFLDLMREMHKRKPETESYLRIMVTRGVGELDLHPASCNAPTVIGIAKPLPQWPAEAYSKGAKVIIADLRRNPKNATNPAIKSGNYLNNVLAIVEARAQNAIEAIMLNVQGNVSECTTSNVFIATKGELHTPDLGEGLLSGITRGYVLELARKLKIKCSECAISREELLAADEVFITSTTRDIMPVAVIGDSKVKHSPGPVTLRLMEGMKQVHADAANLS
ncbi:branched-chain amino acid aminotransferase [Planctomycetaceae bacterium]|nr:branched-chain amino acid aminotransferase [Planctomycetaceae bacterium]